MEAVTVVTVVALPVLLLLLLLLLYLFRFDTRLHRARFAHLSELHTLLSGTPRPDGLLLGRLNLFHRFVCIAPLPMRREIGNLLVVAPTRAGKGLLATSQLLTWQHSVIVNDMKGELFHQTAGYRSRLGEVFVIDPHGTGHRFDPLRGKTTEDELFSSASRLLFQADEGDGAIFTQRATVMLTQLFLASRAENAPPLPYVRQMIRAGLPAAAERLNTLSPQLATQLLDVSFAEANWSDRFLLSAWGTLTARMRPLLTETVIRSFAGSDVIPAQLMQGRLPVSIYLRWPERDLLALSPLVRLVWGSLIDELITTYDQAEGKQCHPVLLLVDEAGRTAIPSLADHATTVVGRGLSLWIALQSLSQLEAVYGKARAQVIRDNMESQLYYRPTDLATAKYLEERLGSHSQYAHSTTLREGEETSQGLAERPIPLLTAQEILQLRDEEVIGFHRNLPPFQMKRIDWRQYPALKQKTTLPPPPLPVLPNVAEIPMLQSQKTFPDAYIDPDMIHEATEHEADRLH